MQSMITASHPSLAAAQVLATVSGADSAISNSHSTEAGPSSRIENLAHFRADACGELHVIRGREARRRERGDDKITPRTSPSAVFSARSLQEVRVPVRVLFRS